MRSFLRTNAYIVSSSLSIFIVTGILIFMLASLIYRDLYLGFIITAGAITVVTAATCVVAIIGRAAGIVTNRLQRFFEQL